MVPESKSTIRTQQPVRSGLPESLQQTNLRFINKETQILSNLKQEMLKMNKKKKQKLQAKVPLWGQRPLFQRMLQLWQEAYPIPCSLWTSSRLEPKDKITQRRLESDMRHWGGYVHP